MIALFLHLQYPDNLKRDSVNNMRWWVFFQEADDSVQRLFVFSRKSSAEAREFYKALQKAARSFVNRADLEIRVIDPEELPMVIKHLFLLKHLIIIP